MKSRSEDAVAVSSPVVFFRAVNRGFSALIFGSLALIALALATGWSAEPPIAALVVAIYGNVWWQGLIRSAEPQLFARPLPAPRPSAVPGALSLPESSPAQGALSSPQREGALSFDDMPRP